MKKLLFLSAALMLAASTFGQAKKPTIMVVPSDRYCIEKGYVIKFNNHTFPNAKITIIKSAKII